MPVSGERFCKSSDMASNPPADAPIATTVKEFAFFFDTGMDLFLSAIFSFGVSFAALVLGLVAISFLETTFFLSDCGVDSIFKAIFLRRFYFFVVISKSI